MRVSTRTFSLLSVSILVVAACNRPSPFHVKDESPRADVDAPFDPPENYPGWAYDAPQYEKPIDDLAPEPKAKPGDPLHYFTKEKVVLIRQPSGYTPEEIPRIAIWWTDNNGFHWHKAGFFGREQSHFPFEVDEDGDYGIRFVGPGQEQAATAPAYPERVYHVDTTLPEVEVSVDPEQSWYHVGQNVTVSWRASDYHLIEMPVNITALLDYTADESKPIEIQKGLVKEGSMIYQIPPETLNHEIRFRADALDRANNLGIAYTHALQVVPDPLERPRSKPQLSKDDVAARVERARNQVENPAGGFDKTAQASAAHESATDDELPEEDLSILGGEPAASYSLAAARQTERPSDTSESSTGKANRPAPLTFHSMDPPAPPDDGGNTTPPRIESAARAPQRPSAASSSDASSDKPAGNESQEASVVELPYVTLRNATKDDLTHGNRLLIPLPATVQSDAVDQGWALARPWRLLGRALETPLRTVWSLPRTRFMDLNPALKGLFLAVQSTRPVGEPPRSDSRVVGVPHHQADADAVP